MSLWQQQVQDQIAAIVAGRASDPTASPFDFFDVWGEGTIAYPSMLNATLTALLAGQGAVNSVAFLGAPDGTLLAEGFQITCNSSQLPTLRVSFLYRPDTPWNSWQHADGTIRAFVSSEGELLYPTNDFRSIP